MLRNTESFSEDNVKYIELAEVSETGTPYKVWTKKIGQGQTAILILSGGPGFSHDYLTSFAENLPLENMTVYFYDQLGTGESQRNLTDEKLWTLDRYIKEVEQVRKGLGLDQFILCGHSWGGMLAIEYALQYQQHLQGLIISSSPASIASYLKSYSKFREMLSIEDFEKLIELEKEEKFDDDEYLNLIMKINKEHVCRKELPAYAIKSLTEANRSIYVTMYGKNEFSPEGNLKDWDIWNDLSKINVATLLSVGRYDMMDVADAEKMHMLMPNATLSICENGGHLSMIDDTENYFKDILNFVTRINLRNSYEKIDNSIYKNNKSTLLPARGLEKSIYDEEIFNKIYKK